MAIRLSCPQCGKNLLAPDNAAGKSGRCKRCSTVFRIPSSADTPPDAVPLSRTAQAIPVSSYDQALAVLTPFVREAQLVPVSWDIVRELFAAVTDPRHFENAYSEESAAKVCASKLYPVPNAKGRFTLELSSLDCKEELDKPYSRSALKIAVRGDIGSERIGYIALAADENGNPRYLVFDFMEAEEASLLREAELAAKAAFRSVRDNGDDIYIYEVKWRQNPAGSIKSWQSSGPAPMASAAADAFAAVLKRHGIDSSKESRID